MNAISVFAQIGILILSVLAHRFRSRYYDSTPCGDDPPIDVDGIRFLGDDRDHNSYSYTYRDPCALFSTEYLEARSKFRDAVERYNRTVTGGEPRRPPSSSSSASPAELWSFPVLVVEKDAEAGDDDNDDETDDETDTAGSSVSLTLDVAILPGDTERFGTIVHSSGVHGVEGYAGSAIQLALLELLTSSFSSSSSSSTLGPGDRPTIVLLHAVNPVGMSEYRRCNENNVDLNRNGIVTSETASDDGVYATFRDFLSKRDPNVAGYDDFRHLFVPEVEKPGDGDGDGDDATDADLPWYDTTIGYFARAVPAIAKYGMAALKRGMVAGQYHHPEGLNYGGRELQVSVQRLLDVFVRDRREFFRDSPQVVWIDVHTGLGPFGMDSVLRRGDIQHSLGRIHDDDDDDDDNETCAPIELDKYLERTAYSVTSSVGKEKGSTAEAFEGYDLSKGMVIELLGDAYRKLLRRSDRDVGNLGGHGGDDRGGGCKSGIFMVQEFGTLPTILVGRALILDNMLYHLRKDRHRRRNEDRGDGEEDESGGGGGATKRRLPYRSPFLGYAFYPQSTEWRRSIIQRGVAIVLHAVEYSQHRSESLSSKRSIAG